MYQPVKLLDIQFTDWITVDWKFFTVDFLPLFKVNGKNKQGKKLTCLIFTAETTGENQIHEKL